MSEVVVVIGSGAIGQAIARRVGSGKRILLADLSEDNAQDAADRLNAAAFDAQAASVDVTTRDSVEALARQAGELGRITTLIHTAGVSPSNAPPAVIYKVDFYGAALVMDVFGGCIAEGGAGLIVSAQAGHRLPPLSAAEIQALGKTPVDQLLDLAMLDPERAGDSLQAYNLAKRGSSLRAAAESVRWARRGARLNAISPGIVGTPLSEKELSGEHSAGYGRMIQHSAAGRVGTPDEVATVAALLLGPDGAYISGSDLLMDGGVTAAYLFGDLEL